MELTPAVTKQLFKFLPLMTQEEREKKTNNAVIFMRLFQLRQLTKRNITNMSLIFVHLYHKLRASND